MDIYLIRHTKTQTVNGLCYGQTDVELADSFIAEVQLIHEKLPKLSEDCLIISSPLARCVKLAQTFSKPIETDDRLQEVNFGDWENQRFDDIEPSLLKKWTENFVTMPPPNGENFSDLCRRTGSFWDELLAQKQAEQVFLITHAGVIRALFAHVLQLPSANAFKLRVDVGSVHKLQHINDYTYIHYINH
ncbi:alpha-ribazole phosphatase [Methyloglobulus sp.]|uniref:alpha-ribazole phosphatase n=1 Tax=Methyloglobulus sp. TaxID=2518622 RepID=UPI0032B7FCC5